MNKIAVLCVFFGSLLTQVYGQQSVSIGTTETKPNAVLYLKGNGSQGLIIPVTPNHTSIEHAPGLIVFNSTDGKVYRSNGSAWAPLEGGTGGGGSDAQNLSITGNALSISNGNTVSLAATAPSQPGQLLMWNGTAWVTSAATIPVAGQVLKWNDATKMWEPGAVSSTPTTAGGDLSGTFPNPTVAKIAGVGVSSTAPTANQVLQYNGTNWTPATLTSGAGTVTAVTGTAPINVTNTTTTPVVSIAQANATTPGFLSSADWTTFNNKIGSGASAGGDLSGSLPNPTIAANAINSSKIADGAITAADLNGMGATNGQVLKFSAGVWSPAADQTIPSLNSTQIFVGNASNVATAVNMSGDATISNTGIVTIASNAINSTKLQSSASIDASRAVTTDHIRNSAVTEAKILDGTIINADINAAAAIAGTKVNPDFGSQNIATTGRTIFNTVSYAWPALQSANAFLRTDGSGNLTWVTSSGWSLSGNSGTTASHFIGTTDNVPLRFKVSNNMAGFIDPINSNTFLGYRSGEANTGQQNSGLGANALIANTGGARNTAIGTSALQSNVTGNNNTAIGYNADVGSGGLTNAIVIGANARVDQSNSLVLGGTAADAVNVGVNTTSPSERLDVNGNFRLSGAFMPNNLAGTAGQVLTSGGSGVAPTWSTLSANNWSLAGNTGTNPATNFIGTTDVQDLVFKTGNSEVMRITSGLNVGIGTTTATRKLEVVGTTSFVDNSTITGFSTQIANNTPGLGQSSGALQVINSGFRSIDNTAMLVSNQTTKTGGSGSTKTGLHVQSTGSWAPTTGQPNVGLLVDVAGADINYSAIFGGGNLGIGTTAPEQALDVNGYVRIGAGPGTSSEGLLLASPAPGTSMIRAGGRATTNFIISQNNNAPMTFYTNGVEKVRIDGAGKVGIGTTAPSTQLEIVGGDVKVDASSDYTYAAPKTRDLTLNHAAFVLGGTNPSVFPTRGLNNDNPAVLRTTGGVAGNAAYFSANVSLPDKATVTGLTAYVLDVDGTYDLTVRLVRQDIGSPTTNNMTSVNTSATPGVTSLATATIANPVVDNSQYSYAVVFKTTESSATLGLYSVRITYTVTQAD